MLDRFYSKGLLALFCTAAALSLQAVETEPARATTSTGTSTDGIRLLSPGPADGRIAYVVARMLENYQYERQPFTDSVSSKFLDGYLEAFDPQHLHFLQSDLEEFEAYRTTLDDKTIPRGELADTRPAYHVFGRFLERLRQRVAYAEEVLKNETFQFDTDERIAVNRKDMPYPKDLDEAKALWRQRLKFEYLQEKLAKTDAKKKAEKEPRAKADKVEKGAPKTEAEQIVDTLTHRYHRNLRTFTDWEGDDVLQIYLTTLARVYDPHSDYFNASQLESFSIGMNLSLFGIGAELLSEDGYCTIRRLLPGGPAEKSKKIKEKDRIIAVAQSNQPPVDVVDMNLTKAVQLIRGPKGTEVRLTVLPAEGSAESVVVSLIRDEIKLDDQAAKARLIETPGPTGPMRLGVIDLPSFYATFDPSHVRGKSEARSTVADVEKLLTRLKKEQVEGIILDLRRNGGGSLEEAIRLTGLFIKQGPVVQVRDTEGTVEEDSDTDPGVAYDGPLVVLTSRFSASASEILAGALQDYGRALVVGDSSTHGKGTVQSVNTLRPFMRVRGQMLTNDPGALKVTIKKFYRASGASTQLKGVVPDIVLPSVFSESKDIGESALDNPMPWDTIPSAKFEKLNQVAPYVSELRRKSHDRIAKDRDFAYVREDIAHFKKIQEDKSVSLNEAERLKEKADAEARQKARDQERLARKESPDKIYEFTLKLAEQPGLPEPLKRTNTLAKASSGAIGSTNASASLAGATIELEDEEPAPPDVDATMAEAQRILMDYLLALKRDPVLASGAPSRITVP